LPLLLAAMMLLSLSTRPLDCPLCRVTDALLLYVQVGEKSKTADEARKIRMENKLKDAKETAAILEGKSAAVRNLLESRKPKKKAVAAPPPAVAAAATGQPSAAKKRKTSNAPNPSPDVSVDPLSYVSKRVARYFGEDDDKKLYFGTVAEFVPAGNVVDGVDLWSVIYDDGDSEDWDKHELQNYLKLYEGNESKDPQGS
jgi:hypothetical protein